MPNIPRLQLLKSWWFSAFLCHISWMSLGFWTFGWTKQAISRPFLSGETVHYFLHLIDEPVKKEITLRCMIFISLWSPDLACLSQSHCSATSARGISNCVQKSANLSQDVMIYRKCGHLRWKICRDHNFLAQPDFSLQGERTKNFHNCPHTEPQSPGRLPRSGVPPLCPLSPTLSPLFPLTLPSSLTLCSLTLSLVRLLCLKSKLPRLAVWVLRLLLID